MSNNQKTHEFQQKLRACVLYRKIRVGVHIGATNTSTTTCIPGLNFSTFDLCFTIQINKRVNRSCMPTKCASMRFVAWNTGRIAHLSIKNNTRNVHARGHRFEVLLVFYESKRAFSHASPNSDVFSREVLRKRRVQSFFEPPNRPQIDPKTAKAKQWFHREITRNVFFEMDREILVKHAWWHRESRVLSEFFFWSRGDRFGVFIFVLQTTEKSFSDGRRGTKSTF